MAKQSTRQESIDCVRSLTKPFDQHSLKVFLGLAGHFRAFTKDYTKISRPLNNLTQNETAFMSNDECEKSY